MKKLLLLLIASRIYSIHVKHKKKKNEKKRELVENLITLKVQLIKVKYLTQDQDFGEEV